MLLHTQYEFDPVNDRIGQGGFATVYKAKDINLNIEVALKRYSKNETGKGSVISEIRKCIRLNHPNIVRYYNCFTHTFTDHLGQKQEEEYGVMEYADSGHFGEIIERKRKISDAEFKVIVSGILDGLEYLHTRNPAIIHRDLKPANILLNNEEGRLVPKICDFGISKVVSSGTATTTSGFLGSIEYMAPEQLNMSKFGKDGHLHPNADLWALGCMLYEYFTGKSPFGKQSEGLAPEVIYTNILSVEPLHGFDKISEPYKSVIQKCLEKGAGKRVQKVGELKDVLFAQIETPKSPDTIKIPSKIPLPPQKRPFNIKDYFPLLWFGVAIILIIFIALNFKISPDKLTVTYVTEFIINNSKGESFTYTGPVDPNASVRTPAGWGKAVFSNGDIYEGGFVNGLRSGNGTYTWSDGEYFVGEFKNNQRDGCGTWYSKTGQILQKGKYVSGEFVNENCP